MPANLDYTSEDALSTLFTTTNFTDELHRYLGLDPSLATAHQPINIDELLTSVLHIVELDQGRNILQKPVTLKLPPWARSALDKKIYLPYGGVSALTTFTFVDTDGDTNSVSGSDYTLFADEPSFVWSKTWSTALASLDTAHPLPITITYTTGYAAFAEIPRSTLQAIRILCYHHFVHRGAEDADLPMAYKHHVSQDQLNFRRCTEFLT